MVVCLPPQAETLLCAPGSEEAGTTLARSQNEYLTQLPELLLTTSVSRRPGTPQVGPITPLKCPYMQEHQYC